MHTRPEQHRFWLHGENWKQKDFRRLKPFMIALNLSKGLNVLVQGKHEETKKVFLVEDSLTQKDNGPFTHSGGRSVRTAMSTCDTVLYMLHKQQNVKQQSHFVFQLHGRFEPVPFSLSPGGWNVYYCSTWRGLMCKECIRGRFAKRRHAAHKKGVKWYGDVSSKS